MDAPQESEEETLTGEKILIFFRLPIDNTLTKMYILVTTSNKRHNMRHTIEIHELTIVTKYGVENAIQVFDATENKQLSYCQTNFDNSREMFAAVESGNVANEDKVYKTFEAETEDDICDYIRNLAYDEWIEKKLVFLDWE